MHVHTRIVILYFNSLTRRRSDGFFSTPSHRVVECFPVLFSPPRRRRRRRPLPFIPRLLSLLFRRRRRVSRYRFRKLDDDDIIARNL